MSLKFYFGLYTDTLRFLLPNTFKYWNELAYICLCKVTIKLLKQIKGEIIEYGEGGLWIIYVYSICKWAEFQGKYLNDTYKRIMH